MSFVKISCGKYCSGWREIHVEFLTNPCSVLKSKVYTPRLTTLNQLQANITREVAQIDPAMMRRAMMDMRARAVKCIAAGGGHFEK